MTHGYLCPCTACTLTRAFDGHTVESDARAQREMADAWASIEAVLSDEAGPTNHDRDHRATAAE